MRPVSNLTFCDNMIPNTTEILHAIGFDNIVVVVVCIIVVMLEFLSVVVVISVFIVVSLVADVSIFVVFDSSTIPFVVSTVILSFVSIVVDFINDSSDVVLASVVADSNVQWCVLENQQSPIYAMNWHFSRCPDIY